MSLKNIRQESQVNKYFLILTSILFLSLVSASFSISPEPINISQKIGVNHTYNIAITNTYNFSIMDFEFSNLNNKGFSFPAITLQPNETKTIPIFVKPTNSLHEDVISIVSFKYLVDLPDEITTHKINISENGFSETYITVRKGDTIMWTNTDDISHRIYSTLFGTMVVAENSSVSYIFNQIGEFTYYDEDFNIFNQFNGNVEVISRTSEQKAHNPNYDIPWTLNLNFFLNPTNITVENSENNYTIEYTKFKKGLLTIENNGTTVAEIITLSSDVNWITFEQNNFNLESGDKEWVEYTIYPSLFLTNDTGKTYNISLKVKASNSEEINIPISVYVPFKEIIGEGTGGQEALEYYSTSFCPKNPCAPICNALLGYPICDQNSNLGTGSGQGSNITANITSVDLYNLIKDLREMADSQARTDNELKELADQLGITVPELKNQLNQSLSIQIENERKQKQRSNTVWIIGFITLCAFIIIYILNDVARKKYGKSIINMFNFKEQY